MKTLKLKFLLKFAHAVEIGAYFAYEGHWRYLHKIESSDTLKVFKIQSDELRHLQAVSRMLRELESKESVLMDAVLWCIGKTIGLACHVMGHKNGMWGAKVMEILGSRLYYRIANAAFDADHDKIVPELISMAQQEEEHEKFFAKFA